MHSKMEQLFFRFCLCHLVYLAVGITVNLLRETNIYCSHSQARNLLFRKSLETLGFCPIFSHFTETFLQKTINILLRYVKQLILYTYGNILLHLDVIQMTTNWKKKLNTAYNAWYKNRYKWQISHYKKIENREVKI